MSVLSIVRPLPAVNTGAGAIALDDNLRLFTNDPKEVSVVTVAGASIVVDLGSVKSIGAVMLNAVSRSDLSLFARVGVAAPADVGVVGGAFLVADKAAAAAPFRYYNQFNAVNARYVEIGSNGANIPVGTQIGNFIVGERFSPTYGHEWGSGRYLVDTSTVARNRAGGFGVERGAIVPGWDFTLGDLTDAERETLFDMLRKVGESNPVVVVEDPDATAGLDARIHYGLFQRLEKYERQQVGVTRWSLKVEEWT